MSFFSFRLHLAQPSPTTFSLQQYVHTHDVLLSWIHTWKWMYIKPMSYRPEREMTTNFSLPSPPSSNLELGNQKRKYQMRHTVICASIKSETTLEVSGWKGEWQRGHWKKAAAFQPLGYSTDSWSFNKYQVVGAKTRKHQGGMERNKKVRWWIKFSIFNSKYGPTAVF